MTLRVDGATTDGRAIHLSSAGSPVGQFALRRGDGDRAACLGGLPVPARLQEATATAGLRSATEQ